MEVPITLPSLKPPADKPNPKQGIGKTVYDINVACVYISLLLLRVRINQATVSSSF